MAGSLNTPSTGEKSGSAFQRRSRPDRGSAGPSSAPEGRRPGRTVLSASSCAGETEGTEGVRQQSADSKTDDSAMLEGPTSKGGSSQSAGRSSKAYLFHSACSRHVNRVVISDMQMLTERTKTGLSCVARKAAGVENEQRPVLKRRLRGLGKEMHAAAAACAATEQDARHTDMQRRQRFFRKPRSRVALDRTVRRGMIAFRSRAAGRGPRATHARVQHGGRGNVTNGDRGSREEVWPWQWILQPIDSREASAATPLRGLGAADRAARGPWHTDSRPDTRQCGTQWQGRMASTRRRDRSLRQRARSHEPCRWSARGSRSAGDG